VSGDDPGQRNPNPAQQKPNQAQQKPSRPQQNPSPAQQKPNQFFFRRSGLFNGLRHETGRSDRPSRAGAAVRPAEVPEQITVPSLSEYRKQLSLPRRELGFVAS
jgi:hypothetical protein